MREALERSRELFRRAALEGDLANLAQESKDLAQEQRQWNQQTTSGDSTRSAQAEQQLARRTDSLTAALKQLATQTTETPRPDSLHASADQARTAAEQMRRAAGAMRQGQRPEARNRGESASRSLDPLGDQLQRQRQQLQQQWRKEVAESMDQALTETSRLAERQPQGSGGPSAG